MVALSGAASHPPASYADNGIETCGKVAAIYTFPKAKLPRLDDTHRACADLVWRTFPAPSQRAVCYRAAAETGAASPDTFARILNGETRHIDFHLMQCVQIIAASRGVAIPPALAVRIGAA